MAIQLHLNASDYAVQPNRGFSIRVPECLRHNSIFRVTRLGRHAIGPPFVCSIEIRLFDTPSHIRNATIVFDNNHIHATVHDQGQWMVFTERQMAALGDRGTCPACHESRLDNAFPIQNLLCGHGCCTMCLQAHTSCPICHDN